MDDEIKDLIEQNLAISEDNNRLLKNIRFYHRLALFWNVFYIAVILGGVFVAFNFLQPYIQEFRNAYNSIIETQTSVKEGFSGFFKKD